MYKLSDLRRGDMPQTSVNGKWIPARPLNEDKKYKSLFDRFKEAIAVFKCKASSFTWD